MQYAIPLARKSDPETSKEAARSVKNVTETQARVLQALRAFGPLTDEQIQRLCGIASPSGLRTRRKELVDQGKVRDSGERRLTRSGRRSIVWRVA